jgi:hypothetical protein
MRFTYGLLPLLSCSPSARVVSVFAPGNAEYSLQLDDLGLKTHYSLLSSICHPSLMTTFFMESLATKNPSISFLHIYPGLVKTQEMEKSEFPAPVKWFIKWIMFPLISPFCISVDETGERMLFHATSAKYPALAMRDGRGDEAAWAPLPEGVEVAVGSDGEKGSGSYCINWDGEMIKNKACLEKYRKKGATEKVSQHTMEVLDSVKENVS